MTVAALTEQFLMNMGYARSDTQEEDVIEEYSGVLLKWLNEGYRRAVRRLFGRKAAQDTAELNSDDDEPSGLDEALQPLLADYAAARAQEIRGNAAAAAALYAAFERGLSEAVETEGWTFTAWERL